MFVRVVRQAMPALLAPLCLIASVLAVAPWLRAFPLAVAGAPLYGAALLSVLVPLITTRIKPDWLWLGFLVDFVVFVVYALTVVLQDPSGFGDLIQGIYRGPSQLLTFALPLVSPRSLMVAPVALSWLAGALAGECVARRWYTMLPYVGFLVTFGLAYAGTQRAAGSGLASARLRETLLAAGLLVALLLLRAAQTWVRQDETAETTQSDGVLPLRGMVVGTVTTLVVALVASLVVQTDAFPKRSDAPQRVPTVNNSNPLTPLSFVAGLRPRAAKDAKLVFDVSLNNPSSGYFALANVDNYDGSGWSFNRTFRPSGGVLPVDADPALRTSRVVIQKYTIAPGALTTAPWMPFLYRAQKVTGTSVNIDAASGMIVPVGTLHAHASYTVVSGVSPNTFDRVKATLATADAATPTTDIRIPGGLELTLHTLIDIFRDETGTPVSPALPFLQALQRDLRTRYSLSSAARGSSTGTPSPSSTPTSSAPSSAKSTRGSTPKATANSAAPDLAGGTGFADVLASILGSGRNGTPEQFATLIALVARELGVPARVATGFRVAPRKGAVQLAAGHYAVTTADAWTWAEIPLVGSGWVVLDGSPGQFAQQDVPTESAAPATPTSTPSSQNALVTEGNNGHAVAPKSSLPDTSSSPRNAVLITLSIIWGLLILALLLILVSRKRVRAARRRRLPDPRTRLVGAWQEGLDVLTEAGLPELATLTTTEIAELTAEQFGAESGAQAASLGHAASAVAYSVATVVAPAEADAAWDQERALRRQVRRQLGWRGRVAASLRYHRTKKAQPPRSPDSWAVAAAAARREALGASIATGRDSRSKRRQH